MIGLLPEFAWGMQPKTATPTPLTPETAREKYRSYHVRLQDLKTILIQTKTKEDTVLFQDANFLDLVGRFQTSQQSIDATMTFGATNLLSDKDFKLVVTDFLECCKALSDRVEMKWSAKQYLEKSAQEPLSSLNIFSNETFFFFRYLLSFLNPLKYIDTKTKGVTLFDALVRAEQHNFTDYLTVTWVNDKALGLGFWGDIARKYQTRNQRYQLYKNLLPKAFELEFALIASEAGKGQPFDLVAAIEKRFKTLSDTLSWWKEPDVVKDAQPIMTSLADSYVKKLQELESKASTDQKKFYVLSKEQQTELESMKMSYARSAMRDFAIDDLKKALGTHLAKMQEKEKDPSVKYPEKYTLEKLGKQLSWPEFLVEVVEYTQAKDFRAPDSLIEIFRLMETGADSIRIFVGTDPSRDNLVYIDDRSINALKQEDFKKVCPFVDDVGAFLQLWGTRGKIYIKFGYDQSIDVPSDNMKFMKQYYDLVKSDPLKAQYQLFQKVIEAQKQNLEAWTKSELSYVLPGETPGNKFVTSMVRYIQYKQPWFTGWPKSLTDQANKDWKSFFSAVITHFQAYAEKNFSDQYQALRKSFFETLQVDEKTGSAMGEGVVAPLRKSVQEITKQLTGFTVDKTRQSVVADGKKVAPDKAVGIIMSGIDLLKEYAEVYDREDTGDTNLKALYTALQNFLWNFKGLGATTTVKLLGENIFKDIKLEDTQLCAISDKYYFREYGSIIIAFDSAKDRASFMTRNKPKKEDSKIYRGEDEKQMVELFTRRFFEYINNLTVYIASATLKDALLANTAKKQKNMDEQYSWMGLIIEGIKDALRAKGLLQESFGLEDLQKQFNDKLRQLESRLNIRMSFSDELSYILSNIVKFNKEAMGYPFTNFIQGVNSIFEFDIETKLRDQDIITKIPAADQKPETPKPEPKKPHKAQEDPTKQLVKALSSLKTSLGNLAGQLTSLTAE